MGRKSRERRERYDITDRIKSNGHSSPYKKKGLASTTKILIGIALLAVIIVGGAIALSPPSSQTNQNGSYPTNVSPVTYSLASVESDSNKVTVPLGEVQSSKLMFVDLKLTAPKETLEYQGRTVPLTLYRGGDYLPLVIISTPSGNTVAGIRTCEPCGSFSFHIVKGANLKCDVCGAEWTLENFSPVSGGCATYPPPKLSATVNGDNVEVDLSALGLQYAA